MANIAWPSGRLFEPQVLSFGEARKRRSSGEPLMGGDEQIGEIAYSHRWVMDVVMRPCASFAERAQQEAWISRIANGANRVTCHHMQHPVPYGTLRGSPTVSGAHAQGATTLVVAGTNAQTVLAGDMLGVTTTAAYALQLVRVVVGGTISGGTVSLTIEPALRASASNGAAIVWDRPAALWKLIDGSWKQTSSAKNAQPIALSFVEVLS